MHVDRQFRSDQIRKLRLLVEDCMHRIDAMLVSEWRIARQHLEKNNTKREYVTATINALAQELFGRHVVHSAHQSSGFGLHTNQSFLSTVYCELTLPTCNQFGKTEVENLRVAIAADHQIFWFQIAMNDSRIVRTTEPISDLDGNVESLLDLKCA